MRMFVPITMAGVMAFEETLHPANPHVLEHDYTHWIQMMWSANNNNTVAGGYRFQSARNSTNV